MNSEDQKTPKTFSDWREARRFRAWELKQKGWTQIGIAEALGVARFPWGSRIWQVFPMQTNGF